MPRKRKTRRVRLDAFQDAGADILFFEAPPLVGGALAERGRPECNAPPHDFTAFTI